MTRKAYDLIKAVLEYGHVNFKGGIGMMDFDEFAKQDDELYEQICKAVKELDEGGENNEETR